MICCVFFFFKKVFTIQVAEFKQVFLYLVPDKAGELTFRLFLELYVIGLYIRKLESSRHVKLATRHILLQYDMNLLKIHKANI